MTSNQSPDTPDQERASVRAAIDGLDAELLELLGRRRKLSASMAQVKNTGGSRLRDQQREEQVLAAMVKAGRRHGIEAHLIAQVFNAIFEDSIRIQEAYLQRVANEDRDAARAVRVAIEGDVGSYSYIAARRHFDGEATELSHVRCADFKEVVRTVEQGRADYAILPIENTTSGAINDVYDVLLHTTLSIIGEEEVAVNHCLLARAPVELSELRRIYGHPQGIAQCSHFLADMRHCEFVYRETTAAVQAVKEGEPHAAAIAGRGAAEAFGLDIIKTDIANQAKNYTRFLIAARKPRKVAIQVPCKTSLVMTTGQKPGSLLEALTLFRDRGINLAKLESRPIVGNPWEEMFYLDLEGNIAADHVRAALEQLTRTARFVKVLGSYPSRHLPPTPVPREVLAAGGSPDGDPEDAAGRDIVPDAADAAGAPLVSRRHKREDTVVQVKGVDIGGAEFVVIAGPLEIESREHIHACARHAREHGAMMLRAGCFEQRATHGETGRGAEAIAHLREAGDAFGLPIVVEIATAEQLERVARHADVLQVGGRNMHNPELLEAVGRVHLPVILGRAPVASIDEWLEAAEFIATHGNQQVILCDAGIRTFEAATRHTLDLAAIPLLRERTHLPVLIDPSSAAGARRLVAPMTRAARTAGAQGAILDIHPAPDEAHGAALSLAQFGRLLAELYPG